MQTLDKRIYGIAMRDNDDVSNVAERFVADVFKTSGIELTSDEGSVLETAQVVIRTLMRAGAFLGATIDLGSACVSLTADYWEDGDDDLDIGILQFLKATPERVEIELKANADHQLMEWLGLSENEQQVERLSLQVSIQSDSEGANANGNTAENNEEVEDGNN